MDKVRFGRALGYGARHAAKALTQAVDAATAPAAPSASRPASTKTAEPARPAPPIANPTAAQTFAEAQRSVVGAHRTVTQAKSQVRNAAKLAGKSALAPVAKFSSVLWLEVTGTFFALVALAMGQAVWKVRDAFKLPPTSHEAEKSYAYAAIFLMFAYFAISSFVRARHRQRQR